MKRILGIDLGVSSIGWSYVLIDPTDTQNNKIINSGVRIIPMGNEKDDFAKGKSITINADRTHKRGARRNLDRWQMRRDNLVEILTANDMFPDDRLIQLDKMSLWQLRSKAVIERIELKELGRVLLHINQRRGYKSNRKTAYKESESSEYLSAIADRSEHLKFENLTIGQFCYKQLLGNSHFRIRGKTYYRGDYEDEFDRIWSQQNKHHNDLLQNPLFLQIKNEIIFYQRPLKSQKGLISKCSFEPWKRVAPKSSPYFQKFRIWQNLNNLVLSDDEGGVFELSIDQKNLLAEELNKKASLTKNQVIKLLGCHPVRKYDLNFDKVEGNRTKVNLMKVFKEIGYDTVDLLDVDWDVDPDSDNAYKFWHLLYSENDPIKLTNTLQQKYGFNEEQAIQVINTSLEQGYANISTKAIRKILPHLVSGEMYSDAMEKAGYRHSHHLTKSENEDRSLLEYIPEIKRNELRNPVVEKILNHLRNLVNQIIDNDEMGRPDEIRVELARELKSNAKSRQKTSENISKNQRYNAEVRERLINEFKIPKPTRSTIERYKLWEETGHISLYTGKPIPMSKLFTGEYDVDHIIPKSRLFDDSFMNKTLCESSINRDKSSETAFDLMKRMGEEAFTQYVQRIKDCNLPFPKRQKLLTSEAEIPDDFITRQLKETQYIAREAKKRLMSVCRDVNTTSGSVTAHLREMWGLNTMMKEISLPDYREKGLTEFYSKSDGREDEKIIDWSKRDDHRHHAIDAIVVAFTDPGIINSFNRLNQHFSTEGEFIRRGWEVDAPWPKFRNDVKDSIEQILISFKPGKRIYTRNKYRIKTSQGEVTKSELTPRGFLHKETIYGKRKRYAETLVELEKVLKKNLIDDIVNEEIRNEIKNIVKIKGGDIDQVIKYFQLEPLKLNGEKVSSVTIFENYFSARVPLSPDFKNASDIIDIASQKAVLERLAKFENNRKKAFANLEENPIWLNQSKGIQIKKVTIKAKASDLTAIHTSESGKPKDYVFTRNNHHVAIYIDEEGKYHEELVTFWEAFERKKMGIDVICRNHSEGYEFVMSLSQNEMFIYEFENIDLNDPKAVSRNLYRVQKISKKNYMFRHHLASTIDYKRDELHIQSIPKLIQFKKCGIDYLGKLSFYD